MKNWSETDDVFPVDFPVGNDFPVEKPVKKFRWSKVGFASLATITFILAIMAFAGVGMIIVGLSMMWWQALMSYPLWTSLSTGAILVVFTFFYRKEI